MAEHADILIVGAGPVGAVCALALAQGEIFPLLLEARAADRRVSDTRTLALSHGSRLILERLGVWQRLAGATPITAIDVSQKGGFGHARLSAAEEGVPALGYVLGYDELTQALDDALQAVGLAVRHDAAVKSALPGRAYATLKLHDGDLLTTRLAVIADGGRSLQGEPRISKDYGQVALVGRVSTDRPHGGLAYERFTPQGPAALLPRGDSYALVCVASPAEAERLLTLDDGAFLAALRAHFGGRAGRFLAIAERGRFPLRLAWQGSRAGERLVRIGNAAQTLHPVAGQGFNLGLRDAWELAQAILDAPTDPGAAATLARYAASRQRDTLPGMGFTDALVEIFSRDWTPLRRARGLGLFALQAVPPLKHFVARRMMFGARG